MGAVHDEAFDWNCTPRVGRERSFHCSKSVQHEDSHIASSPTREKGGRWQSAEGKGETIAKEIGCEATRLH